MDYLQQLLGVVSSYGIRADQAARAIVTQTIDEFALAVSQATGLSFEYLSGMKDDIQRRVMEGSVHQLGFCKGRTKYGVPCKKRVLTGYCDAHWAQGEELSSKRRRVIAHVSRESVTSAYGMKQCVMVCPRKFTFSARRV